MSKIKYKICTKCKKKKKIKEFSKCSCFKDGYQYVCKDCSAEYHTEYHKNNKKELAKKHKEYNEQNKKKNTKQKIKYRKNNKEKISTRNAQYIQKHAFYKNFVKRLMLVENVWEGLKGELLVLCAYCGKKYIPTNQAVQDRIKAINGNSAGELRFYCSENCKQACPTYKQVKYPKGFKKATSREVVPLLRQLVLERDSWVCQKCGATTETAQLHVHHIIPYAQNKMQANDPDSCITLCKGCHEEIHQQEGCNYNDLKCKKETHNDKTN